MIRLFQSKIDRLVKEQSELKIKKQKVDDKRKERCSAIENKLQKLEYKAFVIKEQADATLAELDRKIEKNQKQIKLERDYYNSIAKDEGVKHE